MTTKAKLTFERPWDVYKTDDNGRLIDSDFVRNQMFYPECTLQISNSQISVAIEASIDKELLNDEGSLCDEALILIRDQMERALKEELFLDAFSVYRIRIDECLVDKSKDSSHPDHRKPLYISLTDKQAKELHEQISAYDSVVADFEHSRRVLKGHLEDLTPGGFTYYASEIRQELNHLERMISHARLGVMHQWYHEKIRTLGGDFGDLISAKQSSSGRYRRAIDSARRILFGFRPPKCWESQPPQRSRAA